MGLDTTHNAWHGPYSKFNRFRYSLANQIKINLYNYDGYGESGEKELNSIDHDIMPLLMHSDCDGEFSIEECKRITNGLNQILDNFYNDITADFDFKEKVVQFRDGCLLAIQNNEVIVFH